jgi:NAD-dependent SIR2 family protein deacetylase
MDLNKVIETIKSADYLILTSGAGMSADSGLPTYRANPKEYEKYKELMSLYSFKHNPVKFWNFNINFIRNILNHEPHEGYHILRELVKNKEYFVVTSNVDGYYERAGFDKNRIYEIHGNKLKLQSESMIYDLFSIIPQNFIDTIEFNRFNLPKCAITGEILRPNVLLFNDNEFNKTIVSEQEERFEKFMNNIDKNKKIAILEIGAGTEIPTIRLIGEYIKNNFGAELIRVNLEDGIKMKALDFLKHLTK